LLHSLVSWVFDCFFRHLLSDCKLLLGLILLVFNQHVIQERFFSIPETLGHLQGLFNLRRLLF